LYAIPGKHGWAHACNCKDHNHVLASDERVSIERSAGGRSELVIYHSNESCVSMSLVVMCVCVQRSVWTERFTSICSHQKEVVTASLLTSTSISTTTPRSSD